MLVSIVTPSYNQARFIERTIESVLAQEGDFELEYLVVDGGSTDGTLEILRRYDGRLRWTSERDRGQSDALNKGFRVARGQVLAWINSDDTYAPGAIQAAVEALSSSRARWAFGECRFVDEDDREIRRAISRYKSWVSNRYSFRRLLGRNFIPQQACFFRRDLLEEVGSLVEGYRYAMDYDLWLRFGRVAEPVFIPRELASFRWHGASTTAGKYTTSVMEAFRIAGSHARGLERLALAQHAVHLAGQVAVYRLMDLTSAARASRRAAHVEKPERRP